MFSVHSLGLLCLSLSEFSNLLVPYHGGGGVLGVCRYHKTGHRGGIRQSCSSAFYADGDNQVRSTAVLMDECAVCSPVLHSLIDKSDHLLAAGHWPRM